MKYQQKSQELLFMFTWYVLLCLLKCLQYIRHIQKNAHTVLSSKYIVFDKKSIPIVAYTENTCTVTYNGTYNKHYIINSNTQSW